MNEALRLSLATALAFGLAVALTAGSARAQEVTDPDIRDIRPVVMLLVDTSGSMERMPGGSGASLPMCAGSPTGTNERNRWTTVVEALTGTWDDSDFYCSTRNRAAYTGSPDWNYYLDYHEPPISVGQNDDGILDAYIDRMKFGLMTFDSTYTFSDTHPLLVEESTFLARSADNPMSPGGYSFGGPQTLMYQGCPDTFMVDSGARNEGAPSGALISVGDTIADPRLINQQIQTQLLNVRPFGGTPTASLLHDFEHYLQTHPDVTTDDPLAECRERFAILLTDGQPDEDFRDARYNCDGAGGHCPYPRSHEIAADLCELGGGGDCTGLIDGLFVVAFDVAGGALTELDLIADQGGTVEALVASNREELMARIGAALDAAAPGNTTRSRPAFVTGSSTFVTGSTPTQFEFNAGFRVGQRDDPRTPADETSPWAGVLERTQFECDGSLNPVAEPVTGRVRFDQELDEQDTMVDFGLTACPSGRGRCLLTVLTPTPSDMEGNLIGSQASSAPLGGTTPDGAVPDRTLAPFDDGIDPSFFGITGTDSETRRDYVVDWTFGTTPDRDEHRLGDIYHSSPVAVGPPRIDIADESYNAFRRRPGVADRPTMVYVGTNDGVLHAFVAEDWSNADGSRTLDAGTELWGFIPPVLVSKLEQASSSHQIMLDGTPVVRDVFFRRQPGDSPSGDIYHTVLVMGFRGGARGYFAMDITNPFEPEFMWQYVGHDSSGGTAQGFTYGVPGIGQVLVDVGGVEERGVAILPGGAGELDTARATAAGATGCAPEGVGAPPATTGTTGVRGHQRCWTSQGRVLTWLDLATGEVIREVDESVFNAPLTGGVALYPGDVGTTAQRAFLTDADGVLWSLDFSKRSPSDWEVRPFHDVFWDAGATEGQPAYNPPIVSTDAEGNLVVLQATGDIDQLDGSAANRVVSLTEERSFSSAGVPSYSTQLNWEVRLRESEQVTGPLELFEGTVYFASFEGQPDSSDACSLGQGRIWGVHYRDADATPPAGYSDPLGGFFPQPGFERTPGTGVLEDHFRGPYVDRLVLGVGVTQRPTCVEGADIPDAYVGTRYRVQNVGGGTFQLTAQLSGGAAGAADGAIETVTEQLRAPQSYTTVSSFAGQVDY
ncbi:MAG TPA: PilC/PilY family type IV pilus protein [Sandaracinaceae bacterium LLY-WYZ-13_1]|nr:PilC/PilY family type IV pilus protein [Sandaracinaceae bacterium LLY-WYZ-13_1]